MISQNAPSVKKMEFQKIVFLPKESATLLLSKTPIETLLMEEQDHVIQQLLLTHSANGQVPTVFPKTAPPIPVNVNQQLKEMLTPKSLVAQD